MANQQGSTLKDKIQEFIASVQACQTLKGVSELEALYKSKQKELKAAISPMMDIMVRDALSFRKQELSDLEAQRKADEQEQNSPTLESKNSPVVVDYKDFIKSAVIAEGESDSVVFTYARMNPPTEAHKALIEQLNEVANKTKSLPKVYLSKSHDPVKNPLTYQEKVKYVCEMVPGVNVVDTNSKNLFNIIGEIAQSGVGTIYAVCGDDRINEYTRAGQYFLNQGGLQFTVINSGSRGGSQISATRARNAVADNRFDIFESVCGVKGDLALEMFLKIEQALPAEALNLYSAKDNL